MTIVWSEIRRAVVISASLALLAACGTETAKSTSSGEPGDQAPFFASPSSVRPPPSMPIPEGEVTTPYPVTVLDDGHGAELCLGMVMESLPPQCGGPKITGWDWTDQAGDFEEAAGTRWGEFVVTGSFDGSAITPSKIVPSSEFESPPTDDRNVEHVTSCAEPAGGWVVDRSQVTHEDLDAAFRKAQSLDAYAGSFVDSSRDPRSLEEIDQDAADGSHDVSHWIVNVAVTKDPGSAEAALREIWGGGLCVTTARYTERQLRQIQHAVQQVPGFLSNGVGDDRVDLHVTYDDGSTQDWADRTFGEGIVVVTSALVDAG